METDLSPPARLAKLAAENFLENRVAPGKATR
jgi:hypothetical protein